MAIYILEIQTKKDTINQRYPSLEDAKKALSDLDLTSMAGFAKTADGLVVVNKSEVVSARVYERQAASGFVVANRRTT